jgi:hypothetical protein
VSDSKRPGTGDAEPKLERSTQEFDPSTEIAKPVQALLNEQQIQRGIFQHLRTRGAAGQARKAGAP